MKKTVFSLCLIFFSFSASALNLKMEGKFQAKHLVHDSVTYSKKECREVGGTWKNGQCVYMDIDNVEIKKVSEDQYTLLIQTIATDGQTCEYRGDAAVQNKVQLVVSAPTTDYEMDENTGDAKAIPTDCNIRVQFQSENTLSVNSTGVCRGICNSGMNMDVPSAQRVK